jgi:hypothetical protein
MYTVVAGAVTPFVLSAVATVPRRKLCQNTKNHNNSRLTLSSHLTSYAYHRIESSHLRIQRPHGGSNKMDMNNMFGSLADNSDHMQIPQFQIYPPMDKMQGEPNSSPLMTLVMRPQRCRRDASDCNDVSTTNTYAEQDPVLFPQQIQMPAAPQGNGQDHNGYAQGQMMPAPKGGGQYPNEVQVRLQGINTAGNEHGKLKSMPHGIVATTDNYRLSPSDHQGDGELFSHHQSARSQHEQPHD